RDSRRGDIPSPRSGAMGVAVAPERGGGGNGVDPRSRVALEGPMGVRRLAPLQPPIQHSTDRLTIHHPRATLNLMVEQHLDSTFTALANPTRRGMLADLMLGEKSIGELAAPHRM